MQQNFVKIFVIYMPIFCCQNSFKNQQDCRLEHVHLIRRDGKTKVLRTLASVAGATVINIYKPHTTSTLHKFPLLSSLGCICLIAHCLSWFGYIMLQLQATDLKKYLTRFLVTSYTWFFGIL